MADLSSFLNAKKQKKKVKKAAKDEKKSKTKSTGVEVKGSEWIESDNEDDGGVEKIPKIRLGKSVGNLDGGKNEEQKKKEESPAANSGTFQWNAPVEESKETVVTKEPEPVVEAPKPTPVVAPSGPARYVPPAVRSGGGMAAVHQQRLHSNPEAVTGTRALKNLNNEEFFPTLQTAQESNSAPEPKQAPKTTAKKPVKPVEQTETPASAEEPTEVPEEAPKKRVFDFPEHYNRPKPTKEEKFARLAAIRQRKLERRQQVKV